LIYNNLKRKTVRTGNPADTKKDRKPNISGKCEMHERPLGNTGQVTKNQLECSVQESGAGGARGWEMVKGETGRQVISPKLFLAGMSSGNENARI
jgi:hypothetical protein